MKPAFNADKRPYSGSSWVVFSTKARFGDDTAPALATAVNTTNQTGLPDNHPPPNAPRGPRGSLHNPLPRPAHVPRPAPGAPAAPLGSGNNANRTPIQAVRTPASHPFVSSNGLSTKQGKAPLRFGEASLNPARPLPSQAPKAVDGRLLGTTTPASVSNAQHIPDTVHPSRRALIDITGTPSHVVQTHQDRADLLKASMHHLPTPESGPSKALMTMPIRSSVPRHSATSSQSTTYSPTPSPSSRVMRPPTKPAHAGRSPNKDVTKTPGPAKRKKQVASSELGAPRLHSNSEQLPPTGAQPPVPKLSSRAAGKQPVRSTVSPVDASPTPVSQAQSMVACKVCNTCKRKHSGNCKPLCITCSKRHNGVCRLLSKTHAKNRQSPEGASDQDKTPKPATQNDTSNTEPAETAEPEVVPCKHRLKNRECVTCDCGCGKCHRPDMKCKKQRLEDKEKASRKRKADDRDDADDGDAADDANVAEVKIEASASDSEPIPQPKKKVKKEAKKTKKKTNRWWEIIVVED
jgi:hypothetical protein